MMSATTMARTALQSLQKIRAKRLAKVISKIELLSQLNMEKSLQDFLMTSLGFTKVKILYTDGEMTDITFRPLNMALRAVLLVWDRTPFLQNLPIFDHNYSYYKKIV